MPDIKEETMDTLLHPRQGIYNPTLRFSFTNITEEEFLSAWGGEPIRIPAGRTVELPHYLAVKLVKEMVDKIMIGNAKLNEIEFYKNNPNVQLNTYRAASSLGVPAARKIYEDQICKLLVVDQDSPEVQLQRLGIKQQILSDLKAEPSSGSPLDNAPRLEEFADLTNTVKDETPKKEVKLKNLKTKK